MFTRPLLSLLIVAVTLVLVQPAFAGPVLGACCVPDGTCVETDIGDCAFTLEGLFLGIGTTCEECANTGACCLPDGECVVTTFAACEMAGGSFFGFDTACDACASAGACCLSDGSCSIQPDEFGCELFGAGEWLGAGSTCFECDAIGGCCLPDGSCLETTASDCALTPGARFLSPGTTCADCATAAGACCLPLGGGCIIESNQAVCDVLGAWQGIGSTCDDCFGGCCLPEGGCVQTDLTECDAVGGLFLGSDVPCTECAGAFGACCLPDGSCQLLPALIGLLECELELGGVFRDFETCLACTCLPDFNGDGRVGFSDLTRLLSKWGPCPACPEDLTGNGAVGMEDLMRLLGAWGPCPR